MNLKVLYDLQEVEAAQKDLQLKRQNSFAVLELKRIKREFEEKKAGFQNLEKSAALLRMDLEAFPERILQTEERLKDEEKAVYSREITSARLLAAQEAQVSACQQKLAELKALQLAYQGELRQQEDQLATLKAELEQLYRTFRKKKALALKQEEEYQSQIGILSRQQKELQEQLAADELSWFRKEQGRREGRPIARMGPDLVCGYCHRMATQALFKRAKGKDFCACEQCGRILFIDE
ncbi:MAG: hypothetical protein Q4B50_07945 [Bacillota bacterium]|nr:hypothetical protein [Bacillota bacterium]